MTNYFNLYQKIKKHTTKKENEIAKDLGFYNVMDFRIARLISVSGFIHAEKKVRKEFGDKADEIIKRVTKTMALYDMKEAGKSGSTT